MLRDCHEFNSEVSNKSRQEVLQLLNISNLKPSKIASKTDSSLQALKRHLERLEESKLIEKTPVGEFQITTLGRVILNQIPFFDFLSNNTEYFNTHGFDGIPRNLLQRLGDLSAVKLETNPMKAIQKARDVVIENDEWMFAIGSQIPVEFFDIAKDKLSNNVKYKMVFGKDTIIQKGFYEYPARKSWIKALDDGQVQERYIEHIPINIVVTEKWSQIFFADKKTGVPDPKSIFYGQDELSRKWCMDLFEHYWNNMKHLKNIKMHEI